MKKRGLRKPKSGETLLHNDFKGIFKVMETRKLKGYPTNDKDAKGKPKGFDGFVPITYEDALNLYKEEVPPEVLAQRQTDAEKKAKFDKDQADFEKEKADFEKQKAAFAKAKEAVPAKPEDVKEATKEAEKPAEAKKAKAGK